MLGKLFTSIRPRQWVKNLIIFGPLVFSQNIFDPDQALRAAATFAIFCFLSGSVYLLNDLMDIEKDRQHPVKRFRPLPAGELKPAVAVVALILFSAGSLGSAFFIGIPLGIVAAIYFTLNLFYSTGLKNVVIVDVMLIAIGFVLRVIAGAVALDVPATPWLLMCTILLALFLAFAKRRHELVLLNEQAESHRKVLEHYSAYFLDQMIMIVAASTLMSYALYTIWPDTVAHFGTNKLIYTVPFVLYGLFRYFYLIHMKSEGGSPTRVLLNDKPLLGGVLLWLVACVLIIEGVI